MRATSGLKCEQRESISSRMNPITCCIAHEYFLYDADVVPIISLDLFDVDLRESDSEVNGMASGRGATWFFRFADRSYVMRHFRRGGWMQNLLGDRYIWMGLEKTRAFKEWRLLAQLTDMGLPAPSPLATRVVREGVFYRADIITHRISNASSLAEVLCSRSISSAQWAAIGQCIRRFHNAAVYHADLNAHNILLDSTGRVYLVDFDKGLIGDQTRRWKDQNLARLYRSLSKLKRVAPSFHFAASDFEQLKAGYTRVFDP